MHARALTLCASEKERERREGGREKERERGEREKWREEKREKRKT